MSDMAKINFYENFLDNNDIEIARQMCDEMIDLYGIPCILYRYDGSETELHPFYGDAGTKKLDNFIKIPTFFYCNYQNFQQTLYSYGQAMSQGTKLEGVMKFDLAPKNGDMLFFIRKYDDDIAKFEITNSSLYKNICYQTDIAIAFFDNANSGNVR